MKSLKKKNQLKDDQKLEKNVRTDIQERLISSHTQLEKKEKKVLKSIWTSTSNILSRFEA